MGGIAGIAESGWKNEVNRMLDSINHRGPDGRRIIRCDGITLGVVWNAAQREQIKSLDKTSQVTDYVAAGHVASARVENGNLILERDQIGISPLYYGYNENGSVCFASEVKALLGLTDQVFEMAPGYRYIGKIRDPHKEQYYKLEKKPELDRSPKRISKGLRQHLDASIERFVKNFKTVGSWLSGGLDSSSLTAIARPSIEKLHTFSAGFPNAPDLSCAREVAEYIDADHHELLLTFDDLLNALPEVIRHLESFDALLVRSSISNYLVSERAAKYVSAVISGEGGDELFAGYEYLKSLDPNILSDELIDITARLHNTALQRVDRSASAHGTVAHVGFLDPGVVDFVLRIPAKFKLRKGIEKWILRKTVNDVLPKRILNRRKSKFWKGAGITDLLEKYAESRIGDREFNAERRLSNGWMVNTKEELLYYRIFRKYFGKLKNYSWMGRTKGAPKQ